MIIDKLKQCPSRAKCIISAGQHVFHVSYLSAATMELHGIYSLAAGGLLSFVLVGLLTGLGGGE